MDVRVIQITDATRLGEDELLARVASGGSRLAVQLRDPQLDARQLLALGERLRARSRAAGAKLFVNDRLDVARLVGADGIHLGRRSVAIVDARAFLGEVLVTCSAHTVEEAVRHAEAGADGVLLSPIFSSPGKGSPLGLDALAVARSHMRAGCRLYALGGIDAQSMPRCLAAGADGVAAIRADLTGT